ncbi:DUF1793-domain-containing protein [Rhizodiscina lignyota]|uniref:DUF1793-domain-containing protein n=1 Tax=Rhizodiscina lignyota TaxID=1504668 RepID=A0A9P4ISJ2_9PEZI|nr:DUF1793-domain-containing protein [Rhizodiscina lignyota]
MLSLTFLSILANIAGSTFAASTFSPARPPALPLAVKSPYLNTWLYAGSDDSGNGGYLAGKWPQHWGSGVTGWTGMIRVDGDTYVWMGDPQVGATTVNQTSYTYTSTKSIFEMDVAGKVQMNITFTSPVYPNDMKRQSLTFSYLNVDVESTDGSSHDVQLYTDISAEWVSGENTVNAQWDYATSGGLSYHKVWRQTQLLFSENMVNNQGLMADWGYWYYATNTSDSLSYLQDSDATRNAFKNDGKLGNKQNKTFRPINDDWPVFGYAVDLGSVKGTAPSQLFTLGYTQEKAVQYNTTDGYLELDSLWTSYFDDEVSALSFFHNDYATATSMSNDLDSKISSDSKAAAGQNYLTVTSLSLRQAFAAITPAIRSSGKTYFFLKEISSNGNTNTVDVIFPMHPILLYLNPQILKMLLDPLYENQESHAYPNSYAEHDLGAHFPNATGHPAGDDEMMPVEECGNMLIMTLAYSQSTGDNSYLSDHYAKMKQWVEYLVEDSLIPADQLSTDDFAGHIANQTNLALKGIIGIGAMAEIANITDNSADSSNYSSISKDYISKWQDLGIAKSASPPHTTLQYGNDSTHGLLYNIYGDKLLKLNLVPQSVYDMQSKFYPTVENKYGVPLDTRSTQTKGDWEMFTAATCDSSTRDMFIKDLATWINETPTGRPLTDLYDTNTGGWPTTQFTARPVMGGTYALLALNSK